MPQHIYYAQLRISNCLCLDDRLVKIWQPIPSHDTYLTSLFNYRATVALIALCLEIAGLPGRPTENCKRPHVASTKYFNKTLPAVILISVDQS